MTDPEQGSSAHAGDAGRGGPSGDSCPDGPDADVVASSRVRLARNISGYPFVNRSTDAQRRQVVALLRRVVLPQALAPSLLWLDLDRTPPRERQLLVERRLISRQLAEGDAARAVAYSDDGSVSVMVNEEDHIRLQVVLPGLQLEEALRRADAVDDAIEGCVDFAFDRRWGYLTACPTNVGCGIRVSVMVHVPALRITNEIERVRRAARDLNLAIRGFYGEGSEGAGDFFQVSNQVTLGCCEADLLEQFRASIVPRLIEYERQARRLLLKQSTSSLDDRLHRALAVLRNARLLGAEEALKLLSRVRMGTLMGRLTDVDLQAVNRLFLLVQPAHLQDAAGRDLTPDELRERRALVVRTALR